MYNVIVADDEKNIREGIVELIEWEKLGCKVCASMQNGAQVLKYLEEEKIHVDIIETYHGLTTSKPMQLRCFQSG